MQLDSASVEPTDPELHPFDIVTRLTTFAPGVFRGRSLAPYWNMVGPFGGVTAAVMLRAVLDGNDSIGPPVTLTVNYCAPIDASAFEIRTEQVRKNRATQHWSLYLIQADESGQPVVRASATLVTASRRKTWSATDYVMPVVPAPETLAAMPGKDDYPFTHRYERRLIDGVAPTEWNGHESPGANTRLWMRDSPPRDIDFCSLTALSDIFFPRIWRRRAILVAAGTVSMTLYFHCDVDALGMVRQQHVLGEADGREFNDGFFEQTSRVWTAGQVLLATCHQLVYYKE